MGLIATMTALVLGLMIATAKISYDTQDEAVKHTAAKVLLLDRMLSNYWNEQLAQPEIAEYEKDDYNHADDVKDVIHGGLLGSWARK